MKVIRKGIIKEVKKIRVGDIYVGKCWLCESVCQCEDLLNGHTKHTALFTDEKVGQLALFSKKGL